MRNADIAGLKIVAFVLFVGFVWTLYLFAHADRALLKTPRLQENAGKALPRHLRGALPPG